MSVALLLCLASFIAPIQESGTAPDPVDAVLRRFDSLPEDEQKLVAAEMLSAVLAAEHPVLAAAAHVAVHPRVRDAAHFDQDPARAWDAKEYAPALKLKTKLLDRKKPTWRKICREYLGNQEPKLATAWAWDSGRNALIRPAEAISPRLQTEALLRGRWPSDAFSVAAANGALDARAALDAPADYFAHHYRDRSGRVYRGITLYAMWASGRELEVSDVEAVAWLRRVEGRNDVVSPIPEKLHNPIYNKISAGFAEVREEQILRIAIASRLVDPTAELPPTLAAMGDVIDRGWVALRHDPERMAQLLANCEDRRTAISALVKTAKDDLEEESNAEERARHLDARANFSTAISEAAFDAARAAGLLGFGRR